MTRVDMVDAQNGWAVGFCGQILKTIDGGVFLETV